MLRQTEEECADLRGQAEAASREARRAADEHAAKVRASTIEKHKSAARSPQRNDGEVAEPPDDKSGGPRRHGLGEG
jgi:hypothetical protein